MDYVSLACCLLAFLLYYNTLDAGFVYDDRRAILSNPDLLPTTPLHKLLENDFWGTPLSDSGSHGSYRPLCVLTFRLNYLLGGFQPWGYHLVNVLLHCLATTLIVKVARHVLPKSPVGPAVTGLLFASHPLHTEAVAGIVGRADLAACILYLLSFLAYTTHVKYRDLLCCECRATKLCRDEDRIKQLRSLKYHRFMANLRNQVTNCNWPKKVLPGDSPIASSSRQTIDFSGMCCWWNRCREWCSLGGCLLLSLGAMLSKETGVTVLGICVLYDFLRIPLLNKFFKPISYSATTYPAALRSFESKSEFNMSLRYFSYSPAHSYVNVTPNIGNTYMYICGPVLLTKPGSS
ncbi:hypothetical protein QE152_g37644 [Popillia japonica]|uniref:Uncharacterized protein n=1 Tax=Popillia japonica TaxID=7064 RepID=A0AAW1I9J0_POPJA